MPRILLPANNSSLSCPSRKEGRNIQMRLTFALVVSTVLPSSTETLLKGCNHILYPLQETVQNTQALNDCITQHDRTPPSKLPSRTASSNILELAWTNRSNFG